MNTITFKFKVALQKLPFRNEGEPLKINRNEGEYKKWKLKWMLLSCVDSLQPHGPYSPQNSLG